MLKTLGDFAGELRAVGIPVSMVEVLDAAEALRHVDLADRSSLRSALSATMVKNLRHETAFEIAFDVFFGTTLPDPDEPAGAPGDLVRVGAGGSPEGGGGGQGDLVSLVDAIVAALTEGDGDRLRSLVRQAVDLLSGFQPGRPVGGRYYLYRVMSRLDGDAIRARLLAGTRMIPDAGEPLDDRVAVAVADDAVDALRSEVHDEIVRRLVADRGPEAVARTLRRPLVDDIDLMHATREELDEVSRRVGPLARKLASRLSARRRHGRKGRLDVRRTIRRSLAHGGALVDPRWRPRRISKPELVLLCDVSGSMATFARFTMQLTYAIGHQFSNVRAFAFVDGIDEVTPFLGPSIDFAEALARIALEADVVRNDGHSDYGAALRRFESNYADAVTERSTVIVAGDARNNYRDSGIDVVAAISAQARALHWLNPESRRYWDTGDSIMSTYAGWCDGVHEVRTLRQLEAFVEEVAIDRHRPRHARNAGRSTGR